VPVVVAVATVAVVAVVIPVMVVGKTVVLAEATLAPLAVMLKLPDCERIALLLPTEYALIFQPVPKGQPPEGGDRLTEPTDI